jgi:MFS family permease
MSIEARKARSASRAAAPAADRTYRRLFGQAGFPQLAAGTVLARTAGQLWQIALILFVLQRYHSPALAGFATFLAIVPGLAVSPVAGALLDRHGRLRLILLDYAIAAASLVLLAALSRLGVLGPAPLLAIVAISSLTGPLSFSGTRTLFPLAVPRELWDRANAVDSGSMALATVVGPALAGFFVAWVGGEGAFLITAGVFIASGLVLFGVPDPETEPSSRDPLLRSAWQALVYVVRHRSLRGIVFTLWTINLPSGILAVALPVLVLRQFHWGADAVGALWSVAGVASVIAGLLAGRINTEGLPADANPGAACPGGGNGALRSGRRADGHRPLRAAPAPHRPALVRPRLRRLDEPELRGHAGWLRAGRPGDRTLHSPGAGARRRHLHRRLRRATACHPTRACRPPICLSMAALAGGGRFRTNRRGIVLPE